jgi:hypothetical protein
MRQSFKLGRLCNVSVMLRLIPWLLQLLPIILFEERSTEGARVSPVKLYWALIFYFQLLDLRTTSYTEETIRKGKCYEILNKRALNSREKLSLSANFSFLFNLQNRGFGSASDFLPIPDPAKQCCGAGDP